ncbi:hypothetical protein [Burkholderia sp. YIM B11467]
MSHSSDRRLHVLWADNIQSGPNGKVDLFGVYGVEMRLPEPTTISQMYAFVEVSTPVDRPFQSISLLVQADDEEMVNFNVPATVIAQAKESSGEGAGGEVHPGVMDVRTALRIGLPISGVKVTGRRFLMVRATTEEGSMVGESLMISVAQSARADNVRE